MVHEVPFLMIFFSYPTHNYFIFILYFSYWRHFNSAFCVYSLACSAGTSYKLSVWVFVLMTTLILILPLNDWWSRLHLLLLWIQESLRLRLILLPITALWISKRLDMRLDLCWSVRNTLYRPYNISSKYIVTLCLVDEGMGMLLWLFFYKLENFICLFNGFYGGFFNFWTSVGYLIACLWPSDIGWSI